MYKKLFGAYLLMADSVNAQTSKYDLVGRVFANGPGDILKTLKIVLDTSLLKTQQYKVRIKGKVEKCRGRSSALPYTSV